MLFRKALFYSVVVIVTSVWTIGFVIAFGEPIDPSVNDLTHFVFQVFYILAVALFFRPPVINSLLDWGENFLHRP